MPGRVVATWKGLGLMFGVILIDVVDGGSVAVVKGVGEMMHIDGRREGRW